MKVICTHIRQYFVTLLYDLKRFHECYPNNIQKHCYPLGLIPTDANIIKESIKYASANMKSHICFANMDVGESCYIHETQKVTAIACLLTSFLYVHNETILYGMTHAISCLAASVNLNWAFILKEARAILAPNNAHDIPSLKQLMNFEKSYKLFDYITMPYLEKAILDSIDIFYYKLATKKEKCMVYARTRIVLLALFDVLIRNVGDHDRRWFSASTYVYFEILYGDRIDVLLSDRLIYSQFMDNSQAATVELMRPFLRKFDFVLFDNPNKPAQHLAIKREEIEAQIVHEFSVSMEFSDLVKCEYNAFADHETTHETNNPHCCCRQCVLDLSKLPVFKVIPNLNEFGKKYNYLFAASNNLSNIGLEDNDLRCVSDNFGLVLDIKIGQKYHPFNLKRLLFPKYIQWQNFVLLDHNGKFKYTHIFKTNESYYSIFPKSFTLHKLTITNSFFEFQYSITSSKLSGTYIFSGSHSYLDISNFAEYVNMYKESDNNCITCYIKLPYTVENSDQSTVMYHIKHLDVESIYNSKCYMCKLKFSTLSRPSQSHIDRHFFNHFKGPRHINSLDLFDNAYKCYVGILETQNSTSTCKNIKKANVFVQLITNKTHKEIIVHMSTGKLNLLVNRFKIEGNKLVLLFKSVRYVFSSDQRKTYKIHSEYASMDELIKLFKDDLKYSPADPALILDSMCSHQIAQFITNVIINSAMAKCYTSENITHAWDHNYSLNVPQIECVNTNQEFYEHVNPSTNDCLKVIKSNALTKYYSPILKVENKDIYYREDSPNHFSEFTASPDDELNGIGNLLFSNSTPSFAELITTNQAV